MRVANKRISRADCTNCTCLPGLLLRTNRRLSVMAKRIGLKRTPLSPGGLRKGSVFTIDAASLCLPDVKEINTLARLLALRSKMAEHDLAVYIVPSEDAHLSEYVLPADQRRAFILGFSGSAGVCVVTRDLASMNTEPEGLAALSTDGRYFAQATDELDFNWLLLRQGVDDVAWQDWAVAQAVQALLDSGCQARIGVDPRLVRQLLVDRIRQLIKKKAVGAARVEIVPVQENLVDLIWAQFEEPQERAFGMARLLDTAFAGEAVPAKLAKIAALLKDKAAAAIVVSALDEIAWALNMRGSDIQYNPVFFAYLWVADTGAATLYCDNAKFDSPVLAHLKACNVQVRPYASFFADVARESQQLAAAGHKVLVSAASALWEIVRSLKCTYEAVSPSPLEDLKAVKNATELAGARAAHKKDGRALVRFFAWLEHQLVANTELINEVEADEQLLRFRAEEKNFVGLLFDTISATGANGAIIHYKPVKGLCKTIDPAKMYLNDSGSQFLEGTTDVTRTLHFGQPTPTEIRNYTLVLKGHVALSKLRFPEHTSGNLIDAVARQPLWEHGLDYGHGTGHGIGSFLNVHEGPIGIGPRPNAAKNALKPGHLITNEPGYYENGGYGIRIENVMIVKESGIETNGRKFLEFETVTRVPYCRRLIDPSLLSKEECAWINQYHATVWADLSPMLDKLSVELLWLKRETQPL